MFFSKLYLAIFLAGAIAAPIQNDEPPSKRDTDNAEYSTLLYSIGKRAEGSAEYDSFSYNLDKGRKNEDGESVTKRDSDDADEDAMMYWRNKRAEERATYKFPDYVVDDKSVAKRDTDSEEDSAAPYWGPKRGEDSAVYNDYGIGKRAAYKSKLTYFPDEKREDDEATYRV
ncbi:hypothetical protein ABKA04_005218 [Annulohypoxylon sp. FPYF3050]